MHTKLYMLLLCLLPFMANAVETTAKQAIVIDYQTGIELYAKDADVPVAPSSMSKLMLLYMVFDALESGRVKLDTPMLISEKAWRKGGSKMFIRVGDQVKLEDLLRGVIVQSGNDACIAIAENLAGSEEVFSEQMNIMARKLGLNNTYLVNATGWPDSRHVMSVRDIAKLSEYLIKHFPQYYHYFGEQSFTYNNITQPNRNFLLGKLGVDGLKTGHTDAGGYGIAVSGKQNDRRVIVVVNGTGSSSERLKEAEKLLGYGFLAFEYRQFYKAGDEIAKAMTWQGSRPKVSLTVADPVMILVNKQQTETLAPSFHAKFLDPIPTPIKPGQKLGELVLTLDGKEQIYPLVSAEEVKRLSLLERWIYNLSFNLGRIIGKH